MASASIYDQHQAAFARVSAYVVLDPRDGTRTATIAFKFPADGAGKLYAYVHVLGTQMVRGWASGMGYDKRTPAVESALKRIITTGDVAPEVRAHVKALQEAVAGDGGEYWDRLIEKAGYRVLQAV